MGGGPSPPPAPDPNAIIAAQEKANRVNQTSPFGSQTYGPDGSLTTSLNPQMQGAANLAMNSANTQLHPMNNTQGFGGLQQQIVHNMMNRMSGNMPGGSGGQPGQKMTPQGGQGGPGQMPPAFQSALGQIWGLNGQGGQGGKGGVPPMAQGYLPMQGGQGFAPPGQLAMKHGTVPTGQGG